VWALSFNRETLHWLPTQEHPAYRIAALVRRCQLGQAPDYLLELCCLSDFQGHCTYALQRRVALSPICTNCNYAEPSLFHGGPSGLERAPLGIRLLFEAFFIQLKTVLFGRGGRKNFTKSVYGVKGNVWFYIGCKSQKTRFDLKNNILFYIGSVWFSNSIHIPNHTSIGDRSPSGIPKAVWFFLQILF